MRVVMRAKISGTRNGADWPDVGTSLDLPDDEADLLVRNGLALPDRPEFHVAIHEPTLEKAVIRPKRARSRST